MKSRRVAVLTTLGSLCICLVLAVGAPAEAIVHADSELEGVRQALAWGQPGDLLLLTAHEHREEMLEFMTDLEAGSWQAGDPIPALEAEPVPPSS